MKKNMCIVCENGWIIKGIVTDENVLTTILEDASVVRKWNNGKGIGGIAKEINKKEYILDPIGDIEIMNAKIIFEIPCEW